MKISSTDQAQLSAFRDESAGDDIRGDVPAPIMEINLPDRYVGSIVPGDKVDLGVNGVIVWYTRDEADKLYKQVPRAAYSGILKGLEPQG